MRVWARLGNRRRRTGKLAALALVILAWPAAGAARADDDAPIWGIYNAPPYMIVAGAEAGRGIFDQVRGLLDDRLAASAAPRTVLATFPRVLASIREGRPWCFVGGVKSPDRDEYAYFSLPVSIIYPLAIVVHRSQAERFRAMGRLSLETLLQDRSLRTSLLQGRVLAPGIDDLMRRYGPLPTHSEFDEAYRMLLSDRLDYLVDFTPIAAFAARQIGPGDSFVTLPLKEAPPPGFNRVMCSRTPWGRRMIDRINAILRVERPTPAYRRIVEGWSVGADTTQIRAVYDSVFLHAD